MDDEFDYIDNLICRACAIFGMVDTDEEVANILMESGVSNELAFLAVKAAKVLRQDNA